jgi:rare lipoprotein A
MSVKRKILMVFAVAAFLASCATKDKTGKVDTGDFKGYYKVGKPYEVAGKVYHPKEDPHYDKTGMSSWYGSEFHGKKTANGDTFDKNALTAAHNTLPMPSMVRVTNLENNKTVILMVNDRGPFSKSRVIDVSQRAAEILGFKNKGIAKVRVQFLKGQTQRLLSGVKRADLEKEDEGFSLFQKSEKSPYLVDEDEDENPFEVSSSKKDFVTPAKQSEKKIEDQLASVSTSSSKVATPIVKPHSDSAEELGDWQGDVNDDEIEEKIQKVSTKKEPEIKKLPETKQHFVQAGTYSQITNADRVQKNLVALGDVSVIPVIIGDRKLYRVRLGPIEDEKIAQMALQKVVNLGHPGAAIVKELPSLQ